MAGVELLSLLQMLGRISGDQETKRYSAHRGVSNLSATVCVVNVWRESAARETVYYISYKATNERYQRDQCNLCQKKLWREIQAKKRIAMSMSIASFRVFDQP